MTLQKPRGRRYELSRVHAHSLAVRIPSTSIEICISRGYVYALLVAHNNDPSIENALEADSSDQVVQAAHDGRSVLRVL